MENRYNEMDTFLKELMKSAMDGEKINDIEVYDRLKKYGMNKEDYTITEEDIESSTMVDTKIGDDKWFAKMGIIAACRRNNSRCVSWLPEDAKKGIKEDTRQPLIPSTQYFSRDIEVPYFRHFLHRGFTEYYNEFTGKKEGKFPIKLYIPIGKKDSLDFIMNLIYFIEDSEIWHQSKLASDIRTDDMVIRVYTKEDARKIIDFVNENKGQTLLETNPFLMRDGKVGLAVDGKQSFNHSTSYLIADYIDECKNNGKQEKSGVEDFRNYLQERYNKIYKKGEDIDSILNYSHRASNERQILDMKVIMEALLMSTDPEKDANDFLQYCNSIYGIEKDEQVQTAIQQMRDIAIQQMGSSKDESLKEGFIGFPQLPKDSTIAIDENREYKERYAILEEERRIQREKEAEEYRKSEAIRIEQEKAKEAEEKRKREEERIERLKQEKERKKAAEEAHKKELERRRNDPEFQKRFQYFKELRDLATEKGDTVMKNNLNRLLKVVGAENEEDQDKQKGDDER